LRCVVQRVSRAKVDVGNETTGEIANGLLVLAAFAADDTDAELQWMARKLPGLRIFNDDAGKMNLSLHDVGGGILLVSQFTLYGDCRKGNRPSFVKSAPPARAEMLYDRFAGFLREQWSPVEEGRFAASMAVDLLNRGPVTLIIDRDHETGSEA
jgi:D-aminoacyl-tRNA deacylase